MSKVKIEGNASGTGTLTIAAPNTNTDRTLTLPDEAGTVLTSGGAIADALNVDSAPTNSLEVDSSSNLKFNSGYGSVATAYGVRAWISLNGNASGAIHGSGGVSSYVRNGVGDYDINFAFTMPDASYAVASIGTEERVDRNLAWQSASTTKLTVVYETTGGGRVDGSPISVIVVR